MLSGVVDNLKKENKDLQDKVSGIGGMENSIKCEIRLSKKDAICSAFIKNHIIQPCVI